MKFKVGDFVSHSESDGLLFVVEGWFLADDPNIEPLYQCSIVDRYEFGWHGYAESLLTKAGDVAEDRKPNAIKRATMVLNRLLESAQVGGMRLRRAEQLFEEFCDHWLQNDDPEKTDALSNTLDVVVKM
ncbi:MAG: hypothetical protein AB7G08_28555, partial [Hyphomicrobiaceae bacterium]